MAGADPYAALLEYAWYPETSDRTVATCVEHFAFDASVTQLIFPEAMSGYHECRVIDALSAAGRIPGVRHVVFQDAWYTHPTLKRNVKGLPTTRDVEEWNVIWQACARRHGLTLTACTTYVELRDLCRATDRPSGVIYINGACKWGLFSDFCDPGIHRAAACSFWEWCATHARNKPVNILYGDVRLRGDKEEWGEWVAMDGQ